MEEAGSTYKKRESLTQKMEVYIADNLDNEQFGVKHLAQMMGVSRSQLHRKLKKINGKSISTFIREYRLRRALELLEKGDFNTSEVADKVGFGSASYFSKCFTDYFGYSPSRAKEHYNDGVLPLNDTIKRPIKDKVPAKKYLYIASIGLTLTALLVVFSFLTKKNSTTTSNSKTVLVMPFKNLSNNLDNQYIAEGMVDAINRHLSTIEELNIISSAAVDLSKKEVDIINDINNRYQGAHVLQGSLQHDGNTLRMEVKLVNSATKNQLWAENYDRKPEGLLKIQNDIAKNIALALKAKLTPQELSIIDKRVSYDPEAYDAFLKGWYNYSQFSLEGLQKSTAYFTRAIELDSTLALAYFGMSHVYSMKAGVWSGELTAEEAYRLAGPYLDKALTLDPDLKEAYSSKAAENLFGDWDFNAAEKSFQIALESDFPIVLAMWVNFLHMENRHDEAYEVALELNEKHPFYLNSQMMLSSYYANHHKEGREFVETRLKSYSNHFTLDGSGFFMLNTGAYDEAIELFQKAIDNGGVRFPRMVGWMGAAYAKKGNGQKARELLTELKERKAKTDAGSPAWFAAIIHAALKENEEALKWLTMAVDDHEMEIPWLVSEPQLYPLHGTPQFDALVRKVGFRPHAYPIRH